MLKEILGFLYKEKTLQEKAVIIGNEPLTRKKVETIIGSMNQENQGEITELLRQKMQSLTLDEMLPLAMVKKQIQSILSHACSLDVKDFVQLHNNLLYQDIRDFYYVDVSSKGAWFALFDEMESKNKAVVGLLKGTCRGVSVLSLCNTEELLQLADKVCIPTAGRLLIANVLQEQLPLHNIDTLLSIVNNVSVDNRSKEDPICSVIGRYCADSILLEKLASLYVDNLKQLKTGVSVEKALNLAMENVYEQSMPAFDNADVRCYYESKGLYAKGFAHALAYGLGKGQNKLSGVDKEHWVDTIHRIAPLDSIDACNIREDLKKDLKRLNDGQYGLYIRLNDELQKLCHQALTHANIEYPNVGLNAE